MANAYNLINLKNLVALEKPSAIFIVDTNILIDFPNFLTWKTGLANPIFVISDVSAMEFAFKQKEQNKQHNVNPKFAEAFKSLSNLIKTGNIAKGIHIINVGWLIAVKSSGKA